MKTMSMKTASSRLHMAVLSALFLTATVPPFLAAVLGFSVLDMGTASAATAPGATASNTALANDAGVSQAEVQAGNSWFNSDRNSTGYQNSGQLRTGNPLGGQSQVQGSLAISQQSAATGSQFAAIIAHDYSLYNSYYDSYLTDESLASGASSAYSACIAKKGTNCLNQSGYYSGLAVTAYGQYQYYYGLWNKDVQQQQAMEATAGQQAVLSGASAQRSQQSYVNALNDQNTMSADAQAAATDTQTANAGTNTAAVSSGRQAAVAAGDAIQQKTGVTQNQQSGLTPTASAASAPGASAPGATAFSYTDPLQTAMENANQAAMQDAQTSVIQQQYSDNRSADATTADQQTAADNAAASVAPTPESAAIWSGGASLASGTASAYQQDANQTAATAQRAQQSFVQNQNQANADAVTIANDTNAAAERYAQAQAAKNGVTFTAPTVSDGAVQNRIAQAQSAINQDNLTAEVQAANAYSQQRIATDMTADAGTASQQAQAARSNAGVVRSVSPSLAKTWGAVAGSETASASQAQQAALSATSAAGTDIAAANAAQANAQRAAGSTGMDGAAITQGQNAAQASFQAIQQATGVPQ